MKTRTTQRDQATRDIERLWGNIPVVDATSDLRIFIKQCDIAKATRQDPEYCVLAQACSRLFGSSKVLFYRCVAYVELPDSNGVRKVERFIMKGDARSIVENFDSGKDVIPDAGFLLRAPKPSEKLGLHRKQDPEKKRKWRERKRLEGVARGGSQGLGKFEDQGIVIDLAVRSGTGAVHFTRPKQDDE